MGDGADKIIDVCNAKGIRVSGVFASDGFASGKLFRSFPVTTYAQKKAQFNNFIVLVAFASQRSDVLENIYRIAGEQELYCPDVPVAGDGLFDCTFINTHIDEIDRVYSLLTDDTSRNAFLSVIKGRLTGKISYLHDAETAVSEAYESIIKPTDHGHYIDIGAYNGDTVREYLSYANGAASITAFEPDTRNFRKLCEYGTSAGLDTSLFHNIAAWNCRDELTFFSRSGRSSSQKASHDNCKSVTVKADAADRYITEGADFINIDAEGSDAKVLCGLRETINRFKPTISCAVYHRNEDIFKIPLLMYKLYGSCRLYIRHFTYIPAWDTNCYALPF